MNTYLYAFGIALITSLFLTRTVREWAKRKGWVDAPDSRRKVHLTPTPRVGGVAIFFSFLISVGLLLLLPTAVADYLRENLRLAASIVGLSFLMMLVGLWDDLKSLSPWMKFSAQVVVAMGCWALGFRILEASTHAGTPVSLGIFSLPVTIIWIVGVTNAFNLIDGMDGLAAGAALFAMLAMLAVSLTNNLPLSTALLAALVGATLGFLRYNFHPASIFLGDSGSLLLGFTLSLLAVWSSQKSSAAFSIAVPIVAFGVPVLDTAIAILRRFLSGKPIFTSDRKHIHHMLIERGFNQRTVVIILYGLCGLFGLYSLMFMSPSGRTIGLALAILGVTVWFGVQQLHYPELREFNAHLSRGFHNQRKLIVGSVLVGKMLDGVRAAHGLEEMLMQVSKGLEELGFSRFELKIPSWVGRSVAQPGKHWTRETVGPGQVTLRWTSPCLSCETLQSLPPTPPDLVLGETKNGWSPKFRTTGASDGVDMKCGNCRTEPGLGAPSAFLAERWLGLTDFKIEHSIRLSPKVVGFQDDNMLHTATVIFYHPAFVEYPTSVISVLSQNTWQVLEQSLLKILREKRDRTPVADARWEIGRGKTVESV